MNRGLNASNAIPSERLTRLAAMAFLSKWLHRSNIMALMFSNKLNSETA